MKEKFSIQKKIAISMTLLLTLQLSLMADSTRVEEYHNKKYQKQNNFYKKGPSRSDLNRHQRPGVENKYREKRHYTTQRHPSRVQHVRPPHRREGYRVSNLYRNAYRFRHRGINYRYSQGHFYRPYKHGFRVVSAPIGAIILSLPIEHTMFSYQNRNYYSYDNVYYQRACGMNGYRVVGNPYSNQGYRYNVGEMINTLPLGARTVIIDDVRYYEYANQYFLPKRRSGVKMFLVVDF